MSKGTRQPHLCRISTSRKEAGALHSAAGTCPGQNVKQVKKKKTHGMGGRHQAWSKCSSTHDLCCPGHSTHKDTEAGVASRTLAPYSGLRVPAPIYSHGKNRNGHPCQVRASGHLLSSQVEATWCMSPWCTSGLSEGAAIVTHATSTSCSIRIFHSESGQSLSKEHKISHQNGELQLEWKVLCSLSR